MFPLELWQGVKKVASWAKTNPNACCGYPKYTPPHLISLMEIKLGLVNGCSHLCALIMPKRLIMPVPTSVHEKFGI